MFWESVAPFPKQFIFVDLSSTVVSLNSVFWLVFSILIIWMAVSITAMQNSSTSVDCDCCFPMTVAGPVFGLPDHLQIILYNQTFLQLVMSPEELSVPLCYRIIATMLHLTIFFVGLVGNIVLIFVTAKSKLLRTPTYVYLVGANRKLYSLVSQPASPDCRVDTGILAEENLLKI